MRIRAERIVVRRRRLIRCRRHAAPRPRPAAPSRDGHGAGPMWARTPRARCDRRGIGDGTSVASLGRDRRDDYRDRTTHRACCARVPWQRRGGAACLDDAPGKSRGPEQRGARATALPPSTVGRGPPAAERRLPRPRATYTVHGLPVVREALRAARPMAHHPLDLEGAPPGMRTPPPFSAPFPPTPPVFSLFLSRKTLVDEGAPVVAAGCARSPFPAPLPTTQPARCASVPLVSPACPPHRGGRGVTVAAYPPA